MQRVEFKVQGLVQGVGYRWFVQQKAHALNLKGYVKNCDDGSVFVDVEGENESISKLSAFLKVGPSHSMVQQIYVTEREKIYGYKGFDIRY